MRARAAAQALEDHRSLSAQAVIKEAQSKALRVEASQATLIATIMNSSDTDEEAFRAVDSIKAQTDAANGENAVLAEIRASVLRAGLTLPPTAAATDEPHSTTAAEYIAKSQLSSEVRKQELVVLLNLLLGGVFVRPLVAKPTEEGSDKRDKEDTDERDENNSNRTYRLDVGAEFDTGLLFDPHESKDGQFDPNAT
jgi:hypothetical protein